MNNNLAKCKNAKFDQLWGEWKCLRLQIRPTYDICRKCSMRVKPNRNECKKEKCKRKKGK